MDDQLNPSRIDDPAKAVGPQTPEPEGYTIRLQDIYETPELREAGAKPGDKLINGELVPLEGQLQPVELGYELTAEDIANTEELRAVNAQPGDRLVDGELKRTGREEFFEQFRYAYDPEKSDVGYGAQWLDQRYPSSRVTFDAIDGFKGFFQKGGLARAIYEAFSLVSPDEAYGEGFTEATPEQRREMMFIAKERALYEEAGPYFQPDPESAGAITGEIASALTTPTTVIPLGGSYVRLASGSAGLGGAYTGLQSLAETGEVDVPSTLLSAGIAGVAAPALVATPRLVGLGVSKLTRPARTKAAQKELDKVQLAMNKAVADGKTGDEVIKYVEEVTGATPEKIARAVDLTGVEPTLAKSAQEAEAAVARTLAEDTAVSRQFSTGLDRYLGTLSTRVRNISEPVFGRLRKFEFDIKVNTTDKLNAASNFMEGVASLAPRTKAAFTTNVYNQEFKAAEALLKSEAPELIPEFNVVKKILKNTAVELKRAGHEFTEIADYFPRLVKDLEGLRNSFDIKTKNVIDNALTVVAKAKDKKVRDLNQDETSHVIDMVFRDYRPIINKQGEVSYIKRKGTDVETRKPGAVQERKIREVRPDQLRYYASPEESLQMYIRRAVNDVARRQMFGQVTKGGKVKSKNNADGTFDIEGSIGAFVDREIRAGNLTSDQAVELKELLSSRFIGGEQSPGSAAAWLRDTGYAGTIANPISAITQLGDLGVSGSLNGFRHTIAGMLGNKPVKTVDLGIDAASAELANPNKTARILNTLFEVSGFNAMDRLGKNTFMNAAIRKAQSTVKTEKGVEEFRKKYSNIFGDQTDSVIADLQAKRMSENVKFFAFNELADIQPIALSEMPQWYLDTPNGRLLYMLKSFTLKQYDIARRNIIQEAMKGNVLKASKNAALLLGYMTAANTGTQFIKDFALGRDVNADQIPERALWALLSVYGANQYMAERYISSGQIKEAGINLITPATPLIDAAFGITKEATELGEFNADPNFGKYIKSLPVFGNVVYNWFLGGAEEWNRKNQ